MTRPLVAIVLAASLATPALAADSNPAPRPRLSEEKCESLWTRYYSLQIRKEKLLRDGCSTPTACSAMINAVRLIADAMATIEKMWDAGGCSQYRPAPFEVPAVPTVSLAR
jgi:hypothetical protein